MGQVIGRLEGLAMVEGVAVKKAALEDFAKQLRAKHAKAHFVSAHKLAKCTGPDRE